MVYEEVELLINRTITATTTNDNQFTPTYRNGRHFPKKRREVQANQRTSVISKCPSDILGAEARDLSFESVSMLEFHDEIRSETPRLGTGAAMSDHGDTCREVFS